MELVLNNPTCSGCGAQGGCSCRDRHAPTVNELKTYLVYNEKWDKDARDRLAKEAPEDFAGPDQSFPIKTQEDIDHAARLLGHADDPEAVKGRIVAIAKRKGLSLPDSWKTETTENTTMLVANETYDDGLDPARFASRQAAQTTLHGLPEPDSSSRTDAHDQLARHTLTGLRRTYRGDLQGAAASHARAAKLLDKFGLQSMEGGGDGKFEQHAADLHREAARTCAGLTANRMDGAIPAVNQTEYLRETASPGLMAALGISTNERVDSSFADAAPGPGMADILDEEDRQYDMDRTGKPVRTVSPIQLLREQLGMSFSDQENARRMGVESVPRGEHAFDFSGVTPTRNVQSVPDTPQRSGWEGLAGADFGPTVNESRQPLPTINQADFFREAASPGLLRALGLDAGPTANTTPQGASPVFNYNAGLMANGPVGHGPGDPIPDLKIDYVANCSPGLRKALGL